MKILHVISTINPHYGGPIEGVNQLSRAYNELGIELEVCSNDSPEDEWVKNSKLKVIPLGPSSLSYGYNSRLIPWLKSHCSDYTAVIVNGLWEYIGLAVNRALKGTKIPYFVFTHGMLDPWFKEEYPFKHLKKSLYWLIAEHKNLSQARGVIFTCEEELISARNTFSPYLVREFVTNYGVDAPPSNSQELKKKFILNFKELEGKRIILFLSRIHQKKGCDHLIEAFNLVAKDDPSLHLVMAGPDSVGWMSKLSRRINDIGIQERVTWTGMLEGDMKWGAYYASEVFCLPSHQENFGIVVAEALSTKTPVLITNKINIWREIEQSGGGFVSSDSIEGTVSNLKKWLSLSALDYKVMAEAADKCYLDNFSISRAAIRLAEIITINSKLKEVDND